LLTLEKNLCISQDGELSTGQGLASNGISAPVQENPSPSCLANDTSEEQDGSEEDPLPVFACPDQEEESAEVEQGWEEVETQSDEEEQEQGLLCEEAEEAELACSMQYDEEELEQLNMMVYRVGDEMSTLLSPPSQGQSPAHRPSRGEPPGSRGASSTEASPRRMQGNQGRTGVYVEEEDRVFFMEDLDAAGDSISSISRDACSCVISTSKGSTPPLQQKPAPRPGSGINGWSSETTSEQPCPQPRSLNSPCPVAKRPLCTPARGSEPLPYSNGWDRGLEGTASETAEVIAHRMGGMKLSATVIFNPRSPSLTELAVDKLLLPRPAPTEIEPCGPLMATHCLLNSCVCCGSCEDAHDDGITAETAGLELGLALGLDKHCKTPASSAVIQSAACHLPPCGHQRFSKGEISQHTPPSSRCSAEPQAEDFDSLLCEKCLVAPGRGPLSQDCSSRGGQEASTCVHQLNNDRRPQAIGVRQRDKDMENDRLENKDLKVDPKEDSRRYSSPVSSLTPSSGTSEDLDQQETRLALQDAKVAARNKIRSRFHSSSDLIHRLFVCISVLEDCALCQETISSSELAAKAREGQFEGQQIHRLSHTEHSCHLIPLPLCKCSASDSSAACFLFLLTPDPPDWVPDDACNSCIACKAPFTVIRRKHHCRSCGKV
ncbi:hypothetical protein GOODEAATRI_024693, partial [Goodea atripinnis]